MYILLRISLKSKSGRIISLFKKYLLPIKVISIKIKKIKRKKNNFIDLIYNIIALKWIKKLFIP